ncbi:hypothetical protein Lmor_0722 [Legionella moravica]|uniref:Uncharacterized protein n=1 Tax=Legionella moravica TaxID=39962 RepID=A0A378JVC5_9GAMM|nr:hypothetical protein Lmor_0722 [Legionella moravica]STX62613.1 Uncharacterised protein [Legionella moravica]
MRSFKLDSIYFIRAVQLFVFKNIPESILGEPWCFTSILFSIFTRRLHCVDSAGEA